MPPRVSFSPFRFACLPLRERRESSFSHGGIWKALISTYIRAIPSSGDAPCAGCELSGAAESSASTAKVGAAARHSQSARTRGAPARHAASVRVLLILISRVSRGFRFRTAVLTSRPKLAPGAQRVGVTSVTRLRRRSGKLDSLLIAWRRSAGPARFSGRSATRRTRCTVQREPGDQPADGREEPAHNDEPAKGGDVGEVDRVPDGVRR